MLYLKYLFIGGFFFTLFQNAFSSEKGETESEYFTSVTQQSCLDLPPLNFDLPLITNENLIKSQHHKTPHLSKKKGEGKRTPRKVKKAPRNTSRDNEKKGRTKESLKSKHSDCPSVEQEFNEGQSTHLKQRDLSQKSSCSHHQQENFSFHSLMTLLSWKKGDDSAPPEEQRLSSKRNKKKSKIKHHPLLSKPHSPDVKEVDCKGRNSKGKEIIIPQKQPSEKNDHILHSLMNIVTPRSKSFQEVIENKPCLLKDFEILNSRPTGFNGGIP